MKKFTKLLPLALFLFLLSSVAIGQEVKKAEQSEKIQIEQQTEMRIQEQMKQEAAKADTEEAALQQEEAIRQTASADAKADDGQNIFVEQHSSDELKNEIELSQEHYNLLVEHGLIQDHVLTFESVQQLEEILGEDLVREFKREHD
jgi:hypothetical protein